MMRYLDEFRNGKNVASIAGRIRGAVTKPWTLMEICGGQTHTIVKYGIEELLPGSITLLHGPGCPVCVTSLEIIDRAIAIASRPEVILVSFGDMLRVPGSACDLLTVKARGGAVLMVYSPMDVIGIALRNPEKEVVFFAVGFETTAPATAMLAARAAELGLKNLSILCAHVLVPPAIETLLSHPGVRIDGFLAAGHVCAVMGYEEYLPIAARHRVPVVVTGFEPVDILQGVHMAVCQLENGRAEVENQYARAVCREGNIQARRLMEKVFRVVDRSWRGIGTIPGSGFGLKNEYERLDAELRFPAGRTPHRESSVCRAGFVLRGMESPDACPAFSRECRPEHPLGAPMVSSEGACAAYYRYRKHDGRESSGTFRKEPIDETAR